LGDVDNVWITSDKAPDDPFRFVDKFIRRRSGWVALTASGELFTEPVVYSERRKFQQGVIS
jgi:hypothetical protein